MELQTASPTVIEICRTSAAAALRPDPLLTVSEWADEYRILSARASDFQPKPLSSAPRKWIVADVAFVGCAVGSGWQTVPQVSVLDDRWFHSLPWVGND